VTEEIGAATFLDLRDEVRDLWPEASRRRVDEILPRHAERDGFRAVIERTPAGALAGFAYGYRGPAVLSTQRDNDRALGLYRRRGWSVIVPNIDFGAGYPPFCVLGKVLDA
jgi:ribosomal protein S18 acetylase RimI-like enzyme